MIARLTQLHENPALIRAAARPAGRVAIGLVATALFALLRQQSLLVLPGLWLVLWRPGRRRIILSCTAVALGLNALRWRLGPELPPTWPPPWLVAPSVWLPSLAAGGAVLAWVYLGFLAARHLARLPAPVRRFPQVALHLTTWTLIGLAWIAPDWRLLAAATTTASLLVWRIGYLLLGARRGKLGATGFLDHLFYLWPVLGGGDPVPFAKGPEYLQAHERRAAEDLSRSRLAGLKLLILAGLWTAALAGLDRVVYADTSALPRMRDLVSGARSASVPAAWLVLYLDLVRRCLDLAVDGHVVIGGLRLCGYHVFRNTYKPLLAESVIDFWGRFHYYFKELMLDLFFYPCYLRHFRAWPRLRLLAAVFAAAFLGNMYLHVLAYPDLLAGGLGGALWSLRSRLVYCLLLSVGIAVSMGRQRRIRAGPQPSGNWTRLRRIAGVWTFYGLIHVWSLHPLELTLAQRARTILALFGL